MGELLLAGLSEEAQKTDQMGVEILSDTSSYMYVMRGAHHGQAGYTTLGEPESGLESLIEMVDAMDSSAAEEMAPVAQHAIESLIEMVDAVDSHVTRGGGPGRAARHPRPISPRSGRPGYGCAFRRLSAAKDWCLSTSSGLKRLPPASTGLLLPLEVRGVCPHRPLEDMGREHAFRGPQSTLSDGRVSGGHRACRRLPARCAARFWEVH